MSERNENGEIGWRGKTLSGVLVLAYLGFLSNMFIEGRRYTKHYINEASDPKTTQERREQIYRTPNVDNRILIPFYSLFNNRYEHN